MCRSLIEVWEHFAPRLSELAFEPQLVAAVDQHVAAVRDALGGAERYQLTLGDYTLGFLDALRDGGWQEHTGYDSASLRLTAISWLVREYGLLSGPLGRSVP
jgi:hypothetical protein